jgi:zinc protease
VDRVTGDARNAIDRLRRIGETQPDHIQSYFAAYLTSERARIAVVTPRKDDGRPLPTGLDPSLLPQVAAEEGAATAPPVAPLPSPAGARRFRLENGLEVVIWPRAGFPAVTATLMFRGGEAAANPAGAEFYLDTVLPLRYCGGPPGFRGLTISSDVLPDAVVETARGGADNLSAALLSLAERAAVYRFDDWKVLEALQREQCADLSPEEEQALLWRSVLARGKRRLEQERLALGRSASRKARRALATTMFRGTAYQAAPAADLERFTEADLEAWHRSSRRPENAVLVIVGQVDPAAAEALARGWFTSWRPPPPPRASRPPPAGADGAGAARLFRVVDPGVAQAEIVLACRLPSGSLAEAAADHVLARLLARDLRRRLREQLGATYGVHEELMELKAGSTLLRVTTDVAREQLGLALGEMVRRIDALVARAPGADELRRAQLDVFRDLAGPASSMRLNAQTVRLLMLGQPLEQLDRASSAAAGVSPEAVRGAAAACRRTLNVATVADASALGAGALPGFTIEELK